MKKLLKRSAYAALIIFIGVLLFLAFNYKADIPVEALEDRYFTPESAYLEIDDVKLHVRKRGEGPAIFLIHGSFSSLHTWQEWEIELNKSFTTISMDLPGHGLTGPNLSGLYTTKYYANLVFALADTLGIDTFYVAGNSMGGHIAWKMALRNPKRIKKLILVNAAGYRTTSSHMEDKSTDRPFVFKALDNTLIATLFIKLTPRFLFSQNLKQVYGNPRKITKKQVDRYYDLMLREGNRKATLQRLNQTKRNGHGNISQIKTPTLIIWGAKDNWIPVSHAHGFKESIPNAEMVIFPEAGHIPMEEIPQETSKSVIRFLRLK